MGSLLLCEHFNKCKDFRDRLDISPEYLYNNIKKEAPTIRPALGVHTSLGLVGITVEKE